MLVESGSAIFQPHLSAYIQDAMGDLESISSPGCDGNPTHRPRGATDSLLPSPFHATIHVGFHRRWEFHRRKDLRILQTLP